MSGPHDVPFVTAGSFERFMEHLPSAFAVTNGVQHTLVYANAAFRQLVTLDGHLQVGMPIESLFEGSERVELRALLDRAFRSGVVSRNRSMEADKKESLLMRCTVWPDVTAFGKTENLLIELRAATQDEQRLGLQRRVAERLLLSAIREQDAAAIAHKSRGDAQFLEAEGRRLAPSLDEGETLRAIAGMSLPRFGDWCFVDLVDEQQTLRRLPIVHPLPASQAALRSLGDSWMPLRRALLEPSASAPATEASSSRESITYASVKPSLDARVVEVLEVIGVGSFLTVPLHLDGRVAGAITFVASRDHESVLPEDLALAHELANRASMALERARLHGEAIASRERAEAANQVQGNFLGRMSHELRTPLNAIGGYVELLTMELRGPITAAQRVDLERIRNSQRYLLGLINDLLNLTKVGSGTVTYDIADLHTCDALATGVAMLEPLFAQRQIVFDGISCDRSIVTRGDQERVVQIVVNLLSNAMKFTRPGGHVRIDVADVGDETMISVTDTGIGIAREKFGTIFEPFVQLSDRIADPDGGMGLGLAISRDLARGMGGDLTVESTLGAGSTFTLALPRGHPSDSQRPEDERGGNDWRAEYIGLDDAPNDVAAPARAHSVPDDSPEARR